VRVAANLHKLTAGDGYVYLTRSVAVLDGDDLGALSLADYYSAKGESPGHWGGKGLAALGLKEGDVVDEAQMRALFGEGLHPDADQMIREAIAKGASVHDAIWGTALGRPFGQPVPDEKVHQPAFIQAVAEGLVAWNVAQGLPGKSPVPADERSRIRSEIGQRMFGEQYGRETLNSRELAGFITRASRGEKQVCAGYDVTFTMPKSVSALWAVSPRPVAEQIENAHRTAVTAAVAWLESNVAYTRRGKGGVRQVDVKGLITAVFEHRDSRDSDPHLHTHVAISNKVQAVEDSAWLALDGRVIYTAAVAASEYFNTQLAAELARLGLVLEPVSAPSSKSVSMEVVGVPAELRSAWSSRDAAIQVRASQLARGFEAKAGRPPDPKEAMAIKRQAHLDTRQAKHEPRSYAEQRAEWREQAEQVLGGPDAVEAMLRQVFAATRPEAKPVDYGQIAADTVAAVEGERAVFTEPNIMAAAHRQVRLAGVPAELADGAAQAVTRWVVEQVAVPLTRQDEVQEPDGLRRADGSSVYTTALSAQFTSQTILGAESAILSRSELRDGFVVDDTSLSLALLEAESGGIRLNPGQNALVEAMATSGARVQLALAPAGSGKTTAMRAFADAWAEAGGNVIGLAPSAAAAHELGKATGTVADTLAILTWRMDLDGNTDREPEWAASVGPNTVLLVDEAGMASTLDLAKVTAFAQRRGASVRLIGDDQQLASISAGGVLRDLAQRHGAVTLSELMRFQDPAEAGATLAARDGDTSAIGYWLDRDRVHAVAELAGVDTVVDAWLEDTRQGRESLMIAPTRDLVLQLNTAARDRLGTATAVEQPLRDGQMVSPGDLVITRQNERHQRLSRTDWVKNGDRWTVVDIPGDGRLTVRHQGSGRITRLPADYVAEHVDLGYAVTVHGAQGATVDTAHAIFAGAETRQLAYVATSRGRAANHLYVLVGGSGDEHDAIRPEVLTPATAVEVLEQVLGRDGSQESATSKLQTEHDPARWLGRVVGIYNDALDLAVADLVPADQITAAADELVPGLASAAAWPVLRKRIALAAADGNDPKDYLTRALAGAPLVDAHDSASVILSRLAKEPRPEGPLPWIAGLPQQVREHPTWGPYLAAREQQIRDMATELVSESHAQQPPAWARPYLRDRELVDELIVWRAAFQVAESRNPAASVTGPALASSEAGQWQLSLHRRAAEVSRAEQSAQRWAPRMTQPQILTDPWWPILARRLSLAQRAGMDVPQLLAEAITRGPLPDEHAAAALWWRLADTLAPAAAARETTAAKVRPDWTHQLVDQLPAGVADSVLADPEWPALVAAIDTVTRDGMDPAQVIAAAAFGLNLIDPERDDYINVDDVAVMLTWRVNDLHRDHFATSPDQAAMSVVAAEPEDLLFPDAPPPDPYDDEFAPPPPEAMAPVAGVARIVELNDAAAAYYADQYPGSRAADYVTARFGSDLSETDGITIGYAPGGWDSLTQHLRTVCAATNDELIDAGLAKYSKRGTLIDVFRDRVMLGIRDQHQQLVGFTGRAAPGAPADVPKYMNTPTTAAFHKGEVLYGLGEHTGTGAVPVLAEGAFDALAISLAGDGKVFGVAPCGTSLTLAQAELLAQASPDGQVLVATDQDAPGREAAEKDYWKLAGVGLDPHRLVLARTDGVPVKDPAELYQADQGRTLAATLAMHDLAPSLADTLMASRIAADKTHLDEGNANAYAFAYRDLARIVAVLPAEQWEERIITAAALLGPDPWHADEIREHLYDTATQWHPGDPGDPNRHVDDITRLRNYAAQQLGPAQPAPATPPPSRVDQRPEPPQAARGPSLT